MTLYAIKAYIMLFTLRLKTELYFKTKRLCMLKI